MVHATVSPGASVQLPWRADFNALAYVLAGNGSVGAERRPVRVGQLVVYGPGDAVTLTADTAQDASPNFEVLLLGGRPIGEPVVHYGPFVMNTKDEIIQAMEDYQAGRLGTVPAQVLPHRHSGDVELATDHE